MSKNANLTREKIVEKAIELYNRYGIEYVGVRELAKELGMKGGNITYYFPLKNDLVDEIAIRLAQNNKNHFSAENNTLLEVLNIYKKIYRNHYKFRALMISLPHLLKQSESFASRYKRNQVERTASVRQQLGHLAQHGYIKKLTTAEMDVLQSMVSFNSRFWISESVADNMLEDEDKAINNALWRLAGILSFVATPKGKKDIAAFMKQ